MSAAKRRHLDRFVLAAVLAAVAGFLVLAREVGQGDTRDFDERILRALRNPNDLSDPIGPKWLEEVGRDMTALGGVAVISLVTATGAGYFLLTRKHGALVFWLSAMGGALLVSSLLKGHYHRPRPELVPHLSYVYTSSFPSGHSMLSAVTYLTLGALLARLFERRRLKIYFITVAILLTLLVGVSRVYLGVHYPTDVLAGWTAGLAWAIVCWLAVRFLQRRGAVEPEEGMEKSGPPTAMP